MSSKTKFDALRLSVSLVFVLFLGLRGASAEDYVAASWPNMARTLVRFNALDLADPSLDDEYTIITECDMYQDFYKDDFKWNQVRAAVRKSVDMNKPKFPTAYFYDVDLQLDRYDFASKIYKLTDKTALKNVNTFVLYSVDGTGCGDANVRLFPRIFRAVLSAPFYLDGIPLGEKDTKILQTHLDEEHDPERFIFARFKLRVVYIAPLRKETKLKGQTVITHFVQPDQKAAQTVRLDVKLESVDFYEDPQRTKKFFEFQP